MYFQATLEAHEEDYWGASVGDDQDAVVEEIVQVMATEEQKVIAKAKVLHKVCL